jgi:hypothetical protein
VSPLLTDSDTIELNPCPDRIVINDAHVMLGTLDDPALIVFDWVTERVMNRLSRYRYDIQRALKLHFFDRIKAGQYGLFEALWAWLEHGFFLDDLSGPSIVLWGSPLLSDVIRTLFLSDAAWSIRDQLRSPHLPPPVLQPAGVMVRWTFLTKWHTDPTSFSRFTMLFVL